MGNTETEILNKQETPIEIDDLSINENKSCNFKQSRTLKDVDKNTFAGKMKVLGQKIWKHRVFYAMLAPAIILLAIFAYWPMYGIVIAFKDYKFKLGILGSPWVGFENFETLFNEMDGFWPAFFNTIEINLLKLLFGFPAPILLAIMLNAVRQKHLKNVIQTIVYLPHFVSWVIIAGLLFSLFDSTSGVVYLLFEKMGVKLNVFGNGSQFITLLVISDIWKEVGWGAIIYLAALTGISPEYYEAAHLDGASTIQQFWFITLPLLFPTISIMLILRVGGLIGGGFDQIYNLYNTRVEDVSEVLDTFIYKYGISDGLFSIGTAVGLFTNVINVVLLLITNKIVKLMGGDGLY